MYTIKSEALADDNYDDDKYKGGAGCDPLANHSAPDF